jgi:hypothetical protein
VLEIQWIKVGGVSRCTGGSNPISDLGDVLHSPADNPLSRLRMGGVWDDGMEWWIVSVSVSVATVVGRWCYCAMIDRLGEVVSWVEKRLV